MVKLFLNKNVFPSAAPTSQALCTSFKVKTVCLHALKTDSIASAIFSIPKSMKCPTSHTDMLSVKLTDFPVIFTLNIPVFYLLSYFSIFSSFHPESQ